MSYEITRIQTGYPLSDQIRRRMYFNPGIHQLCTEEEFFLHLVYPSQRCWEPLIINLQQQ